MLCLLHCLQSQTTDSACELCCVHSIIIIAINMNLLAYAFKYELICQSYAHVKKKNQVYIHLDKDSDW